MTVHANSTSTAPSSRDGGAVFVIPSPRLAYTLHRNGRNNCRNLLRARSENPLDSDDWNGTVWYAEHAMEKTLRIVIVDDNPRTRGALTAFLSTMDGVTVSGEASNGGEALAIIGRQSPNIVLMDIQMPIMDGLQATRIIKQKWRQVKVIVLTMYAGFEAQAKRAGADAVLIKGCPADELKTAIRSLAVEPMSMSSTFALYLERNGKI